MTKEDFVSFEIAKLLREKGFDWSCNSYLVEHGKKTTDFLSSVDANRNAYESELPDHKYYSRPTLQMIVRWLREKYDIYIYGGVVSGMTITFSQKYFYPVININRRRKICKELEQTFGTPEEAIEFAIKYTLKNLI